MEDMPKESKNYPHNQEEDRLIRSFGRIKSRKLSDKKNFLIENLLPEYQLSASDIEASKKYKKTCLEIGFGFGDFLFEQAKNNPDKFFIGFEPHINGVVNLLAKLEEEPLKNLKISDQDARVILADYPNELFDEAFILFPDPWPKSKHHKRRLINLEFLDFLSQKVKSRGKLIIATDHDSYKTWILSTLAEDKNFQWLAKEKKDWQQFPDWWIITKYQRKAAAEGRESVIFNLIKNV